MAFLENIENPFKYQFNGIYRISHPDIVFIPIDLALMRLSLERIKNEYQGYENNL
jgi:hypothetical protein